MIDYQANPTPPAKKTGGSPVMAIISGVLAVALVAVSVLYVMEMGKLKTANSNIDDLNANVASLTTQLNTEKANVTDLNTQLTAAKANAADLTTQLTATKADLTSSQAKVTDLTSQLSTATGKVTDLTAQLATANGKVTTTQTSLDKASSDLAAALVTNTTQAATITKIQSPQFFNTLSDLTAWLAKDDTNSNPAYSSYNSITKSYILQIKASRDGYIIAGMGTWTGSTAYYGNFTMAGGVMVDIDVVNDSIVVGPSISVPSRPLS